MSDPSALPARYWSTLDDGRVRGSRRRKWEEVTADVDAARAVFDDATDQQNGIWLDQVAAFQEIIGPQNTAHGALHVLQIEIRVLGGGRARTDFLDMGQLDRGQHASQNDLGAVGQTVIKHGHVLRITPPGARYVVTGTYNGDGTVSRAIEEPTTLTMPITGAPRARASRMAARVSAVSPDCDIVTTRVSGDSTGLR